MADIKNPKLLYLKGILFLCLGLLAATGLLLENWSWRNAILLVVVIWAFARAYYFVFYVIEHYIDDTYKFSGLTSFIQYLLRKRRE